MTIYLTYLHYHKGKSSRSLITTIQKDTYPEFLRSAYIHEYDTFELGWKIWYIDLLFVTEMNSIEKDEVVNQGETHNSVELVV
jgi:hypothetical protein